MNIEIRYDNVLSDILTLLQESLIRYMTNQSVDLAKFKHYFTGFIKNMSKIQEQFHISRMKLSKNLSKLQHLCKFKQEGSKISLQTDSLPHHKKAKSLSKDISTKIYLNIASQQNDDFIAPPKIDIRKRSGTAGVSRIDSKNVYYSIDSENVNRPITGNQRYRDDKYGSINLHPSINEKQETQQAMEKKQRHSFYDDLQKEAFDSRTNTFTNNLAKISYKRNNAQNRFYKINKYF